MSVQRVTSDDDATRAAATLAGKYAVEASERDRDRRFGLLELEALSESGLLGATVPRAFGGADISTRALTEAFRLMAEADASLAQVPHSHFVFLEVLKLQGTLEQQGFYFAEALAGKRFANAQSERSSRTIAEDQTTLEDGVLRGEKFYSTGALFADWLAIRASVPAQGTKVIVYLPRETPGIEVIDDWNGMGQRTTASGTVRLTDVAVKPEQVVPFTPIFDQATTYGSQAQVLHAALDAGLARTALTEAARYIQQGRPWFEASEESLAEEPLLLQQAGELEVTVRAAEALLEVAATRIDEARALTTEQTTAGAAIATAAAKVACARAAVEATSTLFELAGTRSAAESLNLSRYWRDARTHTLHDPTRWKVQHLGRWVVSGTVPPRHGLL